MKTKKEILLHIKETGYSNIAKKQICAFLVGANIKSKCEKLSFLLKGDKSFDDFYAWYTDKQDIDAFYDDLAAIGIGEFTLGSTVVFALKNNKKVYFGEVRELSLEYMGLEPKMRIRIVTSDNRRAVLALEEDFAFIVECDVIDEE